jgi:hypothetical protein
MVAVSSGARFIVLVIEGIGNMSLVSCRLISLGNGEVEHPVIMTTHELAITISTSFFNTVNFSSKLGIQNCNP